MTGDDFCLFIIAANQVRGCQKGGDTKSEPKASHKVDNKNEDLAHFWKVGNGSAKY